MKNKHTHPLPLRLLIFVILHSAFGILHSQVPNIISYQGRVAVGGTNFNGFGQFRFALVDSLGSNVYWRNTLDIAPIDGVPDAAVSLPVTNGLYSVLLGHSPAGNMLEIPASVWSNPDVRLRVWFDDGVNGNQLLTPDQRITPNGYLPDGSVRSAAIANGAVTTAKLAAGSVTSTQLASDLTLGGTTSGTFSGNLTGTASMATLANNATNFTGALAGDVTGLQSATTIAAATVTGKALTGFSSTTGTITASDTILSAINKLNGNVALKAPIASPTFTGTVSGTFSGNGAALTNLNGANLTAGSIGGSQLAAASVTAAKLGTDVGLWSVSGANVFRSAGNVGIGTNSPGRALQVDGTSPAISIGSEFNGRTSLLMAVTAISGGYSIIQSTSSAGGSYGALSVQPYGGDVGIGTETPTAKLEVNGNIKGTSFIGSGAALTNLNGTNLAPASVTSDKLGADVGVWSTSGANVFRSEGSVGIGTATPTAALDVAGTVKATTGIFSVGFFVGEGLTRIHTTNNFDIAIGAPLNPTSDTGGGNVSLGYQSLNQLYAFASGNFSNTAIGYRALYNCTGYNNIALGADAGLGIGSGNNNIYIGNNAGGGTESGTIRLGTQGTHTKTLLVGKVGIGTTSPGVPLDVVGFTGAVQNATYFSYSSTVLTTASTNVQASIRASHEIQATYFSAVSDARIKNVKGRSDSEVDLQTLRGIEVTDYFYKDVIEKGGRPTKKVIAQQVEKVFPQAVSQSTNVIPDIFKTAPIKEGWVKLATDLKVGDRVRLLTEQGHRAEYEVLEVRRDEFRTNFTQKADQVFVYGREVKDFRAVDYEAIAMLNVSATQELVRRLEGKDAEIAALKKQLADQAITMKAQAAKQAVRDEALETRLARLEQSAASNAVKVALKK